MRYLYQRGTDPRRRRVMHLTAHDPTTGEPTMRPICGRVRIRFDTTCNMPLGRPVCKHCRATLDRLSDNASYDGSNDG